MIGRRDITAPVRGCHQCFNNRARNWSLRCRGSRCSPDVIGTAIVVSGDAVSSLVAAWTERSAATSPMITKQSNNSRFNLLMSIEVVYQLPVL